MSVRSRLITATAAIAVAVLALAGCASPTEEPTSVLTIGTSADNPTWDPAQIGTPENTNLYMPAVYDTLLTTSPDGEVQPQVATDWEYSEGNTVLTMRLRDDVTFSDGGKLDAEAVKINFERVREESSNLAVVSNVVVEDEYTVRFELSAPNPQLLQILTTKPSIASPAAIEDPEALAVTPVGSGPYVLDTEASTAGVRYSFVRNPDYWNAEAYEYDEVVVQPMEDLTARLNAIKSGQINVAALDASTADSFSVDEGKIFSRPATWQALIIADRDGSLLAPLGDVRVRQAINYALDKEGMSEALGGGYALPSSQITGLGSPMHVDSLDDAYAFDKDKAIALLADAGYPDGFDLTLPDFGFAASFNAVIKQSLQDIGINVTLETMADDRFGELIEGEWPMFVMSDEFNNIWPNELLEAGVWNPRSSTTPELAALMATVGTSDDEQEVVDSYQAIGTYLVDQAWFGTIFQPMSIYAATPGVDITTKVGQSTPLLSHIHPTE